MHIENGSSTVVIRLFPSLDSCKAWRETAATSYLPVFVTGDVAVDNISKRVFQLYLRGNEPVEYLRWNYRHEDTGYWVSREGTLYTDEAFVAEFLANA